MTDEQLQLEFDYAVVEIMGHNQIVGAVTQANIAGAVMLRVDVPSVGNQDAFTKFYNGSSIYALTPITKAMCEKLVAARSQKPVALWQLGVSETTLIDSRAKDEIEENE